MNKLATIATFIAGAAVGSGITWLHLRKKHEEEIESVKETFTKHYDLLPATKDEEDEPEEFLGMKIEEDEEVIDEEESDEEYFIREDMSEYDEIIETEKYSTTSTHQSYANRPYVITPDEFGELDDYETSGASYYADSILADDRGNQMILDDTIGERNLHYFGEYEEDMLYVRNPVTKIDYEVYLDFRKYSEVYPGRV